MRNLPYSLDWKQLKQWFEKNGIKNIVFVKIVIKQNRSQGYGFVEFKTVEEAQRAIDV